LENSSTKEHNIVVAGDVTIDWLQWITKYDDSFECEGRPNWALYPGTRMKAEPGGALLLANMVKKAINAKVSTHVLNDIENIPPESVIHSITILDTFPLSRDERERKDDDCGVFRVKQYGGYCGSNKLSPLELHDDIADAELVILDDAGNGFREKREVWPKAILENGKNPIIILKMSCLPASGELWKHLVTEHSSNLVLIIDANDLRELSADISRQLSWEQTAEDFYWQIVNNPKIKSIAACRNLIVKFGLDGAIHYTNNEGEVNATLYYDPNFGEDGYVEQYEGGMQGVSAAFVAAFAAEVSKTNLEGIENGILAGIQKSRKLLKMGFGDAKDDPAYPISGLFETSDEENTIFKVAIPDYRDKVAGNKGNWRILEGCTRGKLESIAYEAVTKKTEKALNRVPRARFGKLLTLERDEIESFQSIKNLMSEYLNKNDARVPLSIAVFGPPGSGKSFGVTQLALSMDPKRVVVKEFNVSQFTSIADLTNAFHKVRDLVLEGKIPLVFFDEFDSSFNGELGWLKYFLAPMQDGVFREGETMHPIGKSIFVFAGGTSHTFQQFSRESLDENFQKVETIRIIGKSVCVLAGDTTQTFQHFSTESFDEKKNDEKEKILKKFREAKGIDFASRLRGYVNIMGLNCSGADDAFFIVRRALRLRSLLQGRVRQIFDDKEDAHIDHGVLRAFLKVPEYKHGTRSMEAIIDMSMLTGRKQFDQAALPPSKQLELHVNSEIFLKLMRRDVLFNDTMERLAEEIHEQYRIDQKNNKKSDDPAMQPWETLREDLKESNRKQAVQIPEKLQKIGLDFMPSIQKSEMPLILSEEQVELLAEMEHERWMAERLEEGWVYGSPRDLEKKISPYLVPWSRLIEEVKDWDRNAVRQIPELLEKAGFEVYPLR